MPDTIPTTKIAEETPSTSELPATSLPKVKRPSKADWQQQLLPLMSRMLIGLSIFFFVASFGQLIYLHARILAIPEARPEINLLSSTAHKTSADVRSAAQIQIAANLEAYVLDRRYHQANVLLMSRVWLSYLGFVTGMILAMVGAVFILGKLSEPSTEAKLQTSVFRVAMQSTSPGLILVTLGVVLMLATIIVHHEITVVDQRIYMEYQPLSSPANPASIQETPPILEPIPDE